MEILHVSCVCSAGGRFLLKLGDKEVEYSPEFRFYMTTKLSNPHYTPEISSKTNIVNSAVKEQASEYVNELVPMTEVFEDET